MINASIRPHGYLGVLVELLREAPCKQQPRYHRGTVHGEPLQRGIGGGLLGRANAQTFEHSQGRELARERRRQRLDRVPSLILGVVLRDARRISLGQEDVVEHTPAPGSEPSDEASWPLWRLYVSGIWLLLLLGRLDRAAAKRHRAINRVNPRGSRMLLLASLTYHCHHYRAHQQINVPHTAQQQELPSQRDGMCVS